jgi:dolichyl-phosphate beta-glucosyltransferase
MSLKNKRPELSIVIPALNEEKRIGTTLDELKKFLKTNPTLSGIECEVLVVSANGTDNTHDVARRHGKDFKNFNLLLPGEKVGKGRDVKYGMLRAKGEYIVFMDADLATPLRHLPTFYKEALKGFDVVVATRNLKKHHSYLPRRVLSILGNLAYRILGGVWTEDSQCGFKLFNRRAAQNCFKRQTIMRWGFDMEILTIAKSQKFKTKFIRISDWRAIPGGTFDASHTVKNAIETLHELLMIAKNRVLRTYKI